MRCDTCNEWSEEAETICSTCLSEIMHDQRQAVRQDAHEDVIWLLDDLAEALRTQLKLHEKAWRSNETEKPADDEAKKVLARADIWLGIPR